MSALQCSCALLLFQIVLFFSSVYCFLHLKVHHVSPWVHRSFVTKGTLSEGLLYSSSNFVLTQRDNPPPLFTESSMAVGMKRSHGSTLPKHLSPFHSRLTEDDDYFNQEMASTEEMDDTSTVCPTPTHTPSLEVARHKNCRVCVCFSWWFCSFFLLSIR